MYKNFNIKNIIKKIKLKYFIAWFKPHLYLGWLIKPLLLIYDILVLSKWLSKNKINFSFKKDKKYDFKTIVKNLIIRFKLHLYLGWLIKPLNLSCYLLIFSKQNSENKKKLKNVKRNSKEYFLRKQYILTNPDYLDYLYPN
jgi:hypothetical protein